MSSTLYLSSWHPAFMPNSTADLLSGEADQALPGHDAANSPLPESITESSPFSEYRGSPQNQDFTTITASHILSNEPESVPTTARTEQENHLPYKTSTAPALEPAFEPIHWEESEENGHVTGYTPAIRPATPETEANDDHPELSNLRSALEMSLASPGGVEMDEGPQHSDAAAYHEPYFGSQDGRGLSKADFPTIGPVNEKGHAATASFARTVPRSMDWEEDDEVDTQWSLPEPNNDPFETMGPRDRTNSFPVVPFATNSDSGQEHIQSQLDEFLTPEDQKKDLFGDDIKHTDDFFSKVANREIASNSESNTEEQEQEWFNNHGGQTINDDFGRLYGGDNINPTNFDARFEEGMPLFGDEELQDNLQKERSGSPTLFEDADPTQEDDFFAGIDSAKPIDEGPHHHKQPSLERKSTMQIMNSMHFETVDQPPPASQAFSAEEASAAESVHPSEEDLAAQWQAALDNDELLDDDDILEDGEIPEPSSLDPAAFFGSDDEGFLEDDEPTANDEQILSPTVPVSEANGPEPGFFSTGTTRPTRTNSASRYLPPNATQPQAPVPQSGNPYKPSAPLIGDFSGRVPLPASSPYSQGYGGQAPNLTTSFSTASQPIRPDISKSQSFADKSKGGYSSPYDLPMEVVKPRKRASMQQMSRGYNNAAAPSTVAPPRSTSMYTQPLPPSGRSQDLPTSQAPNTSLSPPVSIQQLHKPGPPPQLPHPGTHSAPLPLRSKASFFEELPMPTKLKPAGRYTPQPVSSAVEPRVYQNVAPYPHAGVTTAPPQSFEPRNSPYTPDGHMNLPPQPYERPFDTRAAQSSDPYPSSAITAPQPGYDPRGVPASSSYQAVDQPNITESFDPRATEGNAQYSQPSGTAQGLVAPPKASPYAILPARPFQPIVPSSRYSPAPTQIASGNPPPPVAQGRYTTAPTNLRSQPVQAVPITPSASFPHQPRTSSPLAQFERSQDHHSFSGTAAVTGGIAMLRKGSSNSEPLFKAPSLPVTQEVDEQEQNGAHRYGVVANQNARPQNHATSGLPQVSQHAHEYQHEGSLSPSKRSFSGFHPDQRYGNAVQDASLIPPQRSQTQSPGRVMAGPRENISIAEPLKRPVSTHGPASPRQAPQGYSALAMSTTESFPKTRPRGLSEGYNYIAPTDGRERDPLQRWRGGPVFAWGVGGTVVTSFPKEVPRYGMGQVQPQIMISPGEIKIHSLKDLYPLDEKLASFPGPLKNKSKKKDTVAWLTTGIDMLDQQNQYLHSLPTLTHENKRREERVILWKILRVMIENDGLLEGNDIVNTAVRAVLSPGLDADVNGLPKQYTIGADVTGIFRAAGTTTQADPVNPAAVDELRKFLLRGEREKAVWEAVDKRLWAHAMLISNTLSRDLFKQVAQEFVQKEVRSIGENTESLAALYEVFAGNFEEIVDELVPASARAGFQMVSTSGSGPSKSSLDGLDRWRETLGLVLSNRSENDSQAINALGKLLSGYGRAEAAHVCFLFARSFSVFGGVDDPLSNMVLVGSDHLRQRHEFDKELESILLSEVYEFGLTLSNTSNMPLSIPHLSVYKLQHATILAQFGQREKALQYCEAIASSITSQTRRSPYHHSLIITALDDLSQRLKQSPKDESSSWISKPSIDKVSTSVWSKFNKFVAGDENDSTTAPGSEAGSDFGPFARIAGGTPTISRSPSNGDIYGSYNGGLPGGVVPTAPVTKAASRYAPGSTYNPSSTGNEHPVSAYGSPPLQSPFIQRQQVEARRSLEDRRSFEEPRTISREVSTGSYQGGSLYAPSSNTAPTPSYSPYAPSNQASYGSSQPQTPTFDQAYPSMHESPQSMPSSDREAQVARFGSPDSYNPGVTQGYTQSQHEYKTLASNSYNLPSRDYETSNDVSYGTPPSSGYEPPSSGYEPPSNGGYEPPSYEPNVMNDEPNSPGGTRPKKKGYMDEDDDQLSVQPRAKTKAEKDNEAEEAFRRAAEADAQKDTPAAASKKGWGLGGWFSGGKKDAADSPQPSAPNKPIKAKLGEESSFVFDPELKRWVNKKAGKDGSPERATPTPPPPKGPPRTSSGPPGTGPTSAPRPNLPTSLGSAPPPQQRSVSAGQPAAKSDSIPENLAVPGPMSRTVSSGSGAGPPSGPPSRPTTSMSNASSIDDLLGPPAARKAGTKKAKKGRGYIDVMGDKK